MGCSWGGSAGAQLAVLDEVIEKGVQRHIEYSAWDTSTYVNWFECRYIMKEAEVRNETQPWYRIKYVAQAPSSDCVPLSGSQYILYRHQNELEL
jgi:hypothetical protein